MKYAHIDISTMVTRVIHLHIRLIFALLNSNKQINESGINCLVSLQESGRLSLFPKYCINMITLIMASKCEK